MTIRQLKLLDDINNARHISIDDALTYNQVTFGSVCYQKWVIFDPKRNSFELSKNGIDSLTLARAVNLYRQTNNGKFSKFVRTNQRVVQMRKTA